MAPVSPVSPASANASFFEAQLLRLPRQRSEQYCTSSQTRAHFFRQVNGRKQTGHCFVGRSALAVRLRLPTVIVAYCAAFTLRRNACSSGSV